jgi:hypothetical protein
LAAALLACAAVPATAAPASGLRLAGVGFDGRVRLGAWTPVWVELTAATDLDGHITVDAAAPSAQPPILFTTPVRVAAGARVRVFVPAIFADLRAPGTVHLKVGRETVASAPIPRLQPVDELLVALSSEPLGVESAALRNERLDIVYVQPDALPPIWQVYEAVRGVVIRDLDERRLDDRQRQALRDWVWTGGRLITMPSGDDTRHMSGPTIRPLRDGPADGRRGRGTLVRWTYDAADPKRRGDAATRSAWRDALGVPVGATGTTLDTTLPTTRAVPPHVHAIAGALVVGYILAIRRAAPWVARLHTAALLSAAALVIAGTVLAAYTAAFARREASGVVGSIVIEALAGTEHGILTVAARTITSYPGAFEIAAAPGALLRPLPPAAVTVVYGEGTGVRGQGTGLQVTGSTVVALPIMGTYGINAANAVLAVTNKSGRTLENPWLYVGGRVQALPDLGEHVRINVDDQFWQSADRLGRTEPNHALLAWAFSRVESDAILKASPAWLFGWWRDAGLGLTWNGRSEAQLQLVMVPLVAP